MLSPCKKISNGAIFFFNGLYFCIKNQKIYIIVLHIGRSHNEGLLIFDGHCEFQIQKTLITRPSPIENTSLFFPFLTYDAQQV
jgi:hypothetical protein